MLKCVQRETTLIMQHVSDSTWSCIVDSYLGVKLNRFKKMLLLLSTPLAALAMSACQSNGDSASADVTTGTEHPEVFQGRDIYLRGEMNDYGVQSAYRLRKFDENRYCTVAPLRSDWSPYRFKFADEDWSKGTNFGYNSPPGVLREGAGPARLNGKSRFEELRYEPSVDGIYRFCIVIENKVPYATVTRLEDGKLTTMDEVIRREVAAQFSIPDNDE